MIVGYRSPFSVFQLLNNPIKVVGAGRFYCFFTYRRKIEIGNKPSRFLWVRSEEDVTDTDIPMSNPKPIEGQKTLGTRDCLVCWGIVHVPSAAHSAALNKSTNDVYDTML